MIKINKLYNSFNSAYNTSQFGHFRPETDFVSAVHEISLWAFNKMGPKAWQDQQFKDLLIPFSKTMNVMIEERPSADIAPYPPDYVYFGSTRMLREKQDSKGKGEKGFDVLNGKKVLIPKEVEEDFFIGEETEYEEIEVRLVQANRWASVTSHKTKGPKLDTKPGEKPRVFVKQQNDGLAVLPKGVGVVVMDYYRLPVAPVFNYTTVTQGPDKYLQFQESGSVHLEWNEAMVPVFLYHLGHRYGLHVHDQLIMQARNINEIFV
jgi:hypothetical protein